MLHNQKNRFFFIESLFNDEYAYSWRKILINKWKLNIHICSNSFQILRYEQYFNLFCKKVVVKEVIYAHIPSNKI